MQRFPNGLWPASGNDRSAATEDSRLIQSEDSGARILVLEVRGNAWTGIITIPARIIGRGAAGATNFNTNLEIKNRLTGATIAGGTGITASGTYEVNIAGLEVVLSHAFTSGSVDVWLKVVAG